MVDKIYMMYHSIRVRDTFDIKRAWDDFYKSHPEIVSKIKDSQDWNFNRALEDILKENPSLDADIEELRRIFLKGHKQYEWDSSVQKEFTKWFNGVKDKYNLGQRKVEVIEYNYGDTTPDSNIEEVYKQAKKNNKAQRDSMIIDLMFSSLTTYETVDQMINPGGFDEQKRNARICTILDNMTSEEVSKLGEGRSDQERLNNGINKILNLSLKEAEKLLESHKKSYNPLTPDTWITFQQRNMSGASLVPMAATQNASHALTQHTKDFRLEDKYVYEFNGRKLKMLNQVTDVSGHYITKNVGSYLAAFVDNAKDAIAGDLNINNITANLLFLLIRLGNEPITASLVLKQPAVDMILKYVNTGRYNLNEAIEQAIQDCANSRTSKNTGATKDQDFTDIWLAKNIVAKHNAGDIHSKFIEEDEFYNNQMKVLVMLKSLFKAAEGLGNVVRAIRFDTQTGGPGGSIAQGLEKIEAVLDILDNKDFPLEGLDFIWDFIGGSDSEEYVISRNFPIQTAFFKWGLDKTLDWYKGLFPHVGSLFQDTITTLKEYTTYNRINEGTKNKIFNQFVLYLMTLVSKDFTGDTVTRNYYINEFPKEFAEFKSKESYLVSQLPLLKRIQYRGSNKYNGSSILVFNNVGKVTDLQAREYRSDLRYLLLNDTTRDMALKLLKYNYYRGLGFSPQGFSTFIPSLLKIDTGTDYVESLEKILDLSTDDSLINIFIDQYIRNNLSDRTFVPEVSYSEIFNEEPPESFKVVVTKASSQELKKFIYRNDSDSISYRHYICYTYKGLPHYYRHIGQGNYSAITPLGDTYYKEYDAKQLNMESVIKKVEHKNFNFRSDYRAAQQAEEQLKADLGGLDAFASVINNMPEFDDIPFNPEDAEGKPKRTINDTSNIEGMLSRFDNFDFNSLGSPKTEKPTNVSTTDTLSSTEEAYFNRFNVADLEAAAAAFNSIDSSNEDLEGNKNCNRIK